jgi:hypothetical protein
MKLAMIPFGVVPVKIQPLNYLDHGPLLDSLMRENEVWNCYSERIELADSAIFLWQTESVKHAFYMASDLLLSYQLENVYVRASSSGTNRKYKILIPRKGDEVETKALIKKFRKDGFQFARLVR